ncbi:MAG: hypothetical protein ACM3TN_19170 [Alphaproteobacteria bacterium]
MPHKQSRKRSLTVFNQRGSLLVQTLSNPLNSAIADGMLAGHYQFRRQPGEAGQCAERALKAATDYGFTHWIAAASVTSGWSLAATGRVQEGIARINQGLELWKATGAKAELPRFTALLAEAYLLAGRVREGSQSVAEATSVMEQTNERFFEAELQRLNGELLLKDRTRTRQPIQLREAENYFLNAIDVARRQKAKSLELRATMSLCRLWQQQGKTKEARQMLKKIYDWFTEGFDTPDLKDAKRMLSELSQNPT